MGQKQETTFAALINKGLPENIYYEKMSNPFRAGTPDFYYEGPAGILWAEYKWIEKPWVEDKLPADICNSRSWLRQLQWLKRAHESGVATAVIVGIGLGKTAKSYWLRYPFCFFFSQDQPQSYIEHRHWIIEHVT